ncbi:nuclease [Candidatus Shapirobacteria bacterium CG_4_9_14_0_2_um_filter_39_11]|uniref:Nuclease n=1 Tax=Candidatus Shapirobacteria bacterium CG_4_9_14_0_2_um_filter_39_11 TaxID=1974478 RepID=A0A2M8ES10_9BACT|nr:MAG: nuclease [Candidatus Shapirobacteria bacterium CG_4_9_14_0_2_um_filter_39_11]
MVLVKIKRKNFIFVIGGVLLLLGGFVLGRINNDNKPLVEPTPTPSLSSPTEVPTETFKVTRVIDGDTIEIEGGERVRYIGIDTPETVDPRKPVQCFGIEASKKNKELVEGKNVRLEKDITDKDKYGRLLRYVYIDNIFINLELVKQGFAFSYTYPPDIKYQAEILAAEAEAREANRGLWAACPIVSPTVLPTEAPTSDCNIKGNISTSGEKIYHLPGCGSYAKTQIDEGRGERWFCSEEEAQAAGWRKALNCP